MQMVSVSRVAATGTLAALMMVSAANAQTTHRMEKHFAVQGNPVITVQNPSGHIQVKAWDKHEVMIVGQSAGNDVEVDTEQAGNRIEVATRIVGSRPAPADTKMDYEISVPAESELQIRTDSGSVMVESVHGDMSFDTVAADLDLQDVAGYLVIKSIGGSVFCTRCAGRLDATSSAYLMNRLLPASSMATKPR